MINSRHYRVRGTNSILLIILFLIVGVYSCAAQRKQRITYFGCETSIGMHRFFIEGEGSFLRNLHIFSSGLSTGVYAGNNLVMARLRAGYYSTTSDFKGELRTMEYDLLVDVYALEFFRTRKNVLDIYLTTGFSHHAFNEKRPTEGGYIPTGTAENVPKTKAYQIIGAGLLFIPPTFRRSTLFFAETLVYNSINDGSEPDMNVFLNIGVKRNVRLRL